MSPVRNTTSKTGTAVKRRPSVKAASRGSRKPKPKDRTTQRWILGFSALFVSLYIFLSVFSYFFNWKADQAIAYLPFGESASMEVFNRGGRLGVKLGNWLVAEAFGVFGLLIPIVLMVLSLRILRFKPVMFNKLVSICLMVMILGSVTLGYIGLFGEGPGAFGTGLGGAHGIYIAGLINSYLSYGTALLLIVLIVFLAVYINRSTIALLNKVGQGVADTTVSMASNVTEYIHHQRESRILVDEEEEQAEIPVSAVSGRIPEPEEEGEEEFFEEESLAPAQGFFSRIFSKRPREAVRPVSEELQSEPVAEKPHRRFKPVVDYDFSYEAESVAPIAPIVPPEPAVIRKVTDFPEEDDDFVVRTVGKQQEQPEAWEKPRVPLTDKREDGMRYREVTDADGFIIREVIKDMDDMLDVLDEAATLSGSEEEEFYSELDMASVATGVDRAPVVESATGLPAAPTGPDRQETIASEAGESIQMGENFTVRVARQEELLPDEMVDVGFYDHTLELSAYQKPPVELLEDHHISVSVSYTELRENKNKIETTLENFGIKIDKIEATVGPTVTLYEIIPAPGVRISKIKNLENDIALSLAALGIRIIAPIPGKGTIGIEVPNKNKQIVSMYSVIKSKKFQDADYDLPVVLGRTIQNECYTIDLAKMPHLLVAGATGQGKSVGLNAIITSLLYKKHPSELKFVMVDPKKVELTVYAQLERHFLAKMASEEEAIITDTQKVVYTLNSLCIEMDSRYDLLKNAGVRNLKEYNAKFAARRLNPNKGYRYLPYIVVVIDEYADLLVTAGREIETPLARIAQLARAVGIHLIIATQRPTADVITGLIKSNIPARIAFRVTSMMNSRTILDHPGAEQLIGRGDMLVQTGGEITRVQCAFMDTPESERIMEYISNQRGYSEAYQLPDYAPESEGGGVDSDTLSKRDGLFEEAAKLVVSEQQGSTSLIQRKFAIGYNRAGRIMDQLEAAGIVGRAQGSKPREVKITDLLQLDQLLAQMDSFH
ncbi:MAG: DNA translocase FtsK [Rikenellaceae bacterium]|nr:DNA translocase FtsK [Rikenellaceae bacterium]